MPTGMELPVTTIPLDYEIDVNEDGNEIIAQFRVKDMPSGQIHRAVAAEESQDGFVSTVEIIDIFHGNTVVYEEGDEIEKGVTFIRFKFRFLREKFAPARNFRHASITLTFDDELHRTGMEPKVVSIAPEAALASNITAVGNETIQSFDAKHRGLGFAMQKKTTIESTAKGTVKGRTTWGGNRCYGNRNVVIWTIDENPVARDGISDFFEAGLLLEREFDNSRFVMKAEAVVYVDQRHRLSRFLGRWRGKKGDDDPVTFDPSKQLGPATEERKQICSSLPEYMKKYAESGVMT
ncbi:hypothetical protein BGX38DRAFT_1141091 [Terfezia claveryi]|nr:hypothetical protein BGX38DRAFT_1141091 [Terfezia claveryi]